MNTKLHKCYSKYQRMHVQGVRFKRITDLILSRDVRVRQSSIPLNSDKEKSNILNISFKNLPSLVTFIN